VSPAPFHSLNLGNPSGQATQDDHQRITENYYRLMSAIGCPSQWPLRVHQVHGASVAQVETDRPFEVEAKADAIVSRDRGRAISVRVADCVPVLIATKDGGTVAAVHAGWRGIIQGVIGATIKRMKSAAGHGPDTFTAAIGPCISARAFEVGEEVLLEFEKSFGTAAPIERRKDGKGWVDLRAAAQIQLMAARLRSENIDLTDRCTSTHGDEFFSHRREKGLTGRMAAVIAPSAEHG
jgi:hypothetical protein